jgi:succinoglycan biosynthesis protein ExoW
MAVTKRVAVVIPYFQRTPGILRKAVASALAQRGVAPHLIVVDDASPVAAADELAAYFPQHAASITIVCQENGGPAAARNRALDAVPAGTEYVAFLDSDDEWTQDHLSHALQALDSGYDFYFADHFQLNQDVSAFQRGGRIVPSAHPQIGADVHLRAYAGDMQDQIMTGNIIGTSTVVYRYARFPALRFREEFVYAGEDYLFWLELAGLTARIAMSDLNECRYGAGVNIFAGSGWGTDKSLIRLHHEIKYRKALPRLFKLSGPQRALQRHLLWGLRRSFVADLLHRLRHRKAIGPALLRKQWAVDPQTFVFSLPLALALVLAPVLRR